MPGMFLAELNLGGADSGCTDARLYWADAYAFSGYGMTCFCKTSPDVFIAGVRNTINVVSRQKIQGERALLYRV